MPPNKCEAMEARVDKIDARLTKVETTLDAMRSEWREGLSDLKNQLVALYGERAEWGKWLRAHIPIFFKWLGWFIAAVCGVYQISQIVKQFA